MPPSSEGGFPVSPAACRTPSIALPRSTRAACRYRPFPPRSQRPRTGRCSGTRSARTSPAAAARRGRARTPTALYPQGVQPSGGTPERTLRECPFHRRPRPPYRHRSDRPEPSAGPRLRAAGRGARRGRGGRSEAVTSGRRLHPRPARDAPSLTALPSPRAPRALHAAAAARRCLPAHGLRLRGQPVDLPAFVDGFQAGGTLGLDHTDRPRRAAAAADCQTDRPTRRPAAPAAPPSRPPARARTPPGTAQGAFAWVR